MSMRQFLCLAALLWLTAVQAADAPPPPVQTEPQPLTPYASQPVGEPFFLLSDASFGADEPARVRLEINQPESLADTGGVDVLLYRVPEPLAFLQQQKNLHRVQVAPGPMQEGLANTLTHLWDAWAVKARLAWRKLFSSQAREAVVKQAPGLKTPTPLSAPSRFEAPPQLKPIPGLPLVTRFRYPVFAAQPIAPPKDLKLAGSSSEFIAAGQGNVHLPLGRLKPGLYLVEAVAGQHRAATLLFVGDTLAVSKVSGQQMLVWTARRTDGAAVPGTQVWWSDGVGVLQRGVSDAEGLTRFARSAPEQTYLFGQDAAGGVFISENFYYDSEIYAAKVYAVTDRPLYRPGDQVQLKVTGREFKNARDSVPLKDAPLALSVLDPAGQVIHTQTLRFASPQGADGAFWLPANAPAGGYELRMTLGADSYSAAFRVADYRKPHFEIAWLPGKPDFKTGEPVTGQLQLHYPDGKPVAGARIGLTARAQRLSMVEGELDYSGAFPLKLTQAELTTNSDGRANFSLPAATEPSRYVLTALATDGAAYRVRTSQELLIERGASSWRLQAERAFSAPGAPVRFAISPSARLQAGGDATPPTRWEWLRQENRETAQGALADPRSLTLAFAKPGSYTLRLRDAQGRITAATSHFVSGDGLQAPAGQILLVADQPRYAVGATAQVLVTFPEAVDHALVTLERERVEQTALLGRATPWLRSERVQPTQWRLTVPITEAMSPNMTLSVAYVKGGEMVFENLGLLVAQPRVALQLRSDKPVYKPGETVTLDVTATLAGQPVAADVALGVVDEMIYVLQPEIAPPIDAFYFHPRRNNVRTGVSQSFIGYDLATRALGTLPARRQVQERAVKMLERPRRDAIDTALWAPRLRTDDQGRARVRFVMPDALTRWRITARAIVPANGAVGQQVGWLRSDQPFYAKWAAPDWRRSGDAADATVALFNQTGQDARVQWQAQGAGLDLKGEATLKPGASFVTLPWRGEGAPGALTFTLTQGGKPLDRLATPLRTLPVAWRSPRELTLNVGSGSAALALPADASDVRVSFAADTYSAHLARVADQLMAFPYGCVEQTASRMIPLAQALQALTPAQQSLAPQLAQRLGGARLALAQMATPEAQFGWWGRGMAADALMTTYAYYADWQAGEALHAPLPKAHWERLYDVYAKDGVKQGLLQRALMLGWMQQMGLQVDVMVDALLAALDEAPAVSSARAGGSLLLAEAPQASTLDAARVWALHLAQAAKRPVSAEQRAAGAAAAARLAGQGEPLWQALLIATGHADKAGAGDVLARVAPDAPTFDRALTLAWLRQATAAPAPLADLAPPAPWQRGQAAQPQWRLPAGAPLPRELNVPAGAAAVATVRFESREDAAATLPAQVERRLYRVTPQPARPAAKDAPPDPVAGARLAVTLTPVKPGTPLDSNALYLDELRVSAKQPLRWALVEAALPPGAAVEASTWGIDLNSADGKTLQPLERAQHQDTAQGYAVPIERLEAGGSVAVRHLVRFAQRGDFKLPPARVWRMYQPEGKAYEGEGGWRAMGVR